jgi:hypothetical protein
VGARDSTSDPQLNADLRDGMEAVARYHQAVRNQMKKNEKHSAYRTAGKKGIEYV